MCLFDKTGTITSDRLLAEALVTPQPTDTNGPPVTVKLGRIAKGGETSAASERASGTVVGARGRLAAEVRDAQLVCFAWEIPLFVAERPRAVLGSVLRSTNQFFAPRTRLCSPDRPVQEVDRSWLRVNRPLRAKANAHRFILAKSYALKVLHRSCLAVLTRVR